MRAPPPVALSIGPARRERVAVAVLAAVAAGVLALWWQQAWLAGPAGAAAAALTWRLCPMVAGTLAWNGRQWSWQAVAPSQGQGEPREALALEVMIDAGIWMLLRLRRQDEPALWLPVWRRDAASAWHPLRATLYASVRSSPAQDNSPHHPAA